VNFVSRSIIDMLAVSPHSSISMEALGACCMTQVART
jgi:hypothetical protein